MTIALQWVLCFLAWAFLGASFVQTNVILSVWSAVVAVFFVIMWAALHMVQCFDTLTPPAKAPRG